MSDLKDTHEKDVYLLNLTFYNLLYFYFFRVAPEPKVSGCFF